MTSTPIAKMVREMIARGVDPEVIELAVSTAEAALAERSSADVRVTERDVTAERRRESDRIRQQRYRDNLRMSRDNPQNPQMSQNASLSKEEKIEENKEEREASRPPASRASRGHRLPSDWRPSPDDRPEALAKLGSSAAVEQEILKFHDYWKAQPGQRGVKLDWDATWRNWIRNAKGTTTNGQRSFNEARRSSSADFFAGLASVAADIAGNDQPSRDAGPEIPSGRINIDG